MRYIIGSDEVGLGAWAGPLVVCAFAAPVGWTGPAGLADSKEFKTGAQKRRRALIYGELHSMPFALMSAENTVIDSVGMGKVLARTHAAAILQLLPRFPDAEVIVDGTVPILAVPQARCVPRADSTYPAVMAASVVAKVNRDFVMQQHHKQYPQYGFDHNAGYGGKKSAQHYAALEKYGVTPLHRRSYKPIKALLFAQRQGSLFEER